MLEPPFTLRSYKPQLTLFSLVRIPLGVAIFVATVALSFWGLRELGLDGDMGLYIAFGFSLVATIVALRPLDRIFPYRKQQDLKLEGDRVELSDLRGPLGWRPSPGIFPTRRGPTATTDSVDAAEVDADARGLAVRLVVEDRHREASPKSEENEWIAVAVRIVEVGRNPLLIGPPRELDGLNRLENIDVVVPVEGEFLPKNTQSAVTTAHGPSAEQGHQPAGGAVDEGRSRERGARGGTRRSWVHVRKTA